MERKFILYALRAFNFGEDFCGWIETLYRDAQMSVINDGFTSEWFPCERGTFQGSPISGMLFIIAIELLANRIRRCTEVSGIVINEIEVKVSLYADDMTLFLKDEESMGKCLSILEEFKTASGLDINIQKTKMMWLGRNKHRNDPLLQIEAVEKVKILGIYFSARNSCYRDNVEKVIENTERVTNMWNKRDLTIKGRVTVAKSLILSQITYIASSYLIESKDIHRIQSHIMRFLWRGRPPKVAKKVMWQDISLGGLKAPCVEALIKALQVTWIKRMCTSRGSGWRRLLQGRIGEFDLVDVVRTQRSEYALKRWNIPMFYRIAIIEFQKINEIKLCTGDDVRKVILWNSDDICINNTSVFNKSLYGAGVKYIGQITNLTGDFSPMKYCGKNIHVCK